MKETSASGESPGVPPLVLRRTKRIVDWPFGDEEEGGRKCGESRPLGEGVVILKIFTTKAAKNLLRL